jgi:hypothetical protein
MPWRLCKRKREPSRHLARHSDRRRQIRKQCLDPWAGRDDRGAGFDHAAIGGDADPAGARLDGANSFSSAQLGPGIACERHESVDRGLGCQVAALGLQHPDIMRRHPEGRETPHQVGRRKEVVTQVMQRDGGKRSRHQRAVGRPDLEYAGNVKERPRRRRLDLAPQRNGAPHQRHIGRVLEISEPDDAGLPMGRAAGAKRSIPSTRTPRRAN